MRLRREPDPSPDTLRALAAVDAALAGDRVNAEHDELRVLAIALRDERPQARPEFELALDLRVHEGFPREDRPGIHTATPARRRELHTPHRLRTTPLALATAASVFIVATALLTTGLLGGGGRDDRGGSPAALDEPLVQKSAPAGREAQSQDRSRVAPPVPQATAAPALSAPAAGATAPAARGREVERSAELVLSSPRDGIEDVADDVIQVVDRHGGFVLSSSVSAGDESDAGANFDLRIPTARLDAAVADLSDLSHVRSRTQASRDVTAEFASPRRRLADALAERRGLLRQLARAGTPNETAVIRARLRAANRRIGRVQAELRRLRQRVRFSSVSVAVRPGAGKDEGAGGWSLGDAARDALSVLRAVAGASIVALAVALPAGLLVLLALLAQRAVVRRRREQVLDVPAD